MYFHNFLIISPWKREWPFIWTNLNPLQPRCSGDIWRFFNFVNVFSLFRNYLPLEEGRALHLNKTESPSPKDALCQVWLKLTMWFWRRRWKCEKFTITTKTPTTMTTMDIRQILIRKADLSLRLRWAKNKNMYPFILNLKPSDNVFYTANDIVMITELRDIFY
mgnify:CR=1 FL=1